MYDSDELNKSKNKQNSSYRPNDRHMLNSFVDISYNQTEIFNSTKEISHSSSEHSNNQFELFNNTRNLDENVNQRLTVLSEKSIITTNERNETKYDSLEKTRIEKIKIISLTILGVIILVTSLVVVFRGKLADLMRTVFLSWSVRVHPSPAPATSTHPGRVTQFANRKSCGNQSSKPTNSYLITDVEV